MIIAKQFEPFVIPCKPTSPRVSVELLREDGEVKLKEISYNETIGFHVSSDEVIEGHFIECSGTLSNNTQQTYFSLYVDRRFLLRYSANI